MSEIEWIKLFGTISVVFAGSWFLVARKLWTMDLRNPLILVSMAIFSMLYAGIRFLLLLDDFYSINFINFFIPLLLAFFASLIILILILLPSTRASLRRANEESS